MASKEPEDPSNNTAETDEETVAARRKRLRRVSFADREITSVHIFNRDEDYGTPPSVSKPTSSFNAAAAKQENESPGFFRNLADSDDSREFLCSSPDEGHGDGGDLIVDGKLFLRPRGSPSSGASTIGSATSDDEDNFFGPVSAHFVRPGRLSDSGASDKNRDVTMDSTAFSMHFRSLVRSEVGDLNTPTRNQLPFVEKTPSGKSYRTDTDYIIVSTAAKKNQSPLLVGKKSGDKESNDMSLVGNDLHKFDYGRLSPRLQALLAEEDRGLVTATTGANIEERSPGTDKAMSHHSWFNGSGQKNHGYSEKLGDDSRILFAEGDISELVEVNVTLAKAQSNQIAHGMGPNEKEGAYKMESRSSLIRAESSAINCTPLAKSYEGEYDLNTHRESGSGHKPENQVKLDSAKHERQNSSIHQQLKPPLPGSISSSALRGQALSLGTEDTSLSYVTPSPKQHGGSLCRENLKLLESLSTIQKSKSRIKLISAASPASALMNRIQSSKLTLSRFLSSIATSADTGRQKNDKSLWNKHVDVPITNLETELTNVDPKKSPNNRNINLERDGSGSKSGDVDFDALSEDSLSLNDVYASIVQDLPSSLAATAVSFSKQDEGYFPVVENPTKGTSLVNSDSLPGDVTFDCRNSKQTIDTPRKFPSPPDDISNVERVSITDNEGLQYQHMGSVSRSSTEEENLIENGLSGRPDKLYSGVTEFSLPLNELSCMSDSAQRKPVGMRGSPILETQNITNNTGSSMFLSKYRDTQEFQSGGLGKNIQTATSVTRIGEEVPERVIEKVASPSASFLVVQRNSEPQLAKLNLGTSPLASSLKKPINYSPNNQLPNTQIQKDFLCAEEGVLSPEPELHESVGDEHNERSRNLLSYMESSTRLKRKYQNDSNGAQRAQKALKGGEHIYELVHHSIGDMKGNKSLRDRFELKDWNDVLIKLSTETHEFLAPIAAKLNFNLIGILEDVLESLKKVHLCEVLCFEIKSQKAYDKLSRDKNKRYTETRSLLYKIAYGKAKKELLQLRRERLLKTIQIVISRSQETNMLRWNYAMHQCQDGKRDAQVNDGLHSSCLEQHKVTTDKRIQKEQKLEGLDTEIKNLTKSLHVFCKVQGEPTYSKNIAILENRLKKRIFIRLIRQDMLLWGVEALQSRNSVNDVVLNYSDFVNQRLTIKCSPVSTLLVSNNVNYTIVKKYFPYVDAQTAFTALFNSETTKRCIVSKTLAQETQTTSLRLSNLLDVIEELQLAQIELQNMVHASFISPSAGQLYLQVSFIGCRIIGKVIVTLDITCLTRGIYLSDVAPRKLLKVYADGAETSISESHSVELKSVTDKVGVGYPRILKLCRIVSPLFQL